MNEAARSHGAYLPSAWSRRRTQNARAEGIDWASWDTTQRATLWVSDETRIHTQASCLFFSSRMFCPRGQKLAGSKGCAGMWHFKRG